MKVKTLLWVLLAVYMAMWTISTLQRIRLQYLQVKLLEKELEKEKTRKINEIGG